MTAEPMPLRRPRRRRCLDLDQDGITDAGQLKTLAESGITSISLLRMNMGGTNEGHVRGFQSAFTHANGNTGTADTIDFATHRQDAWQDPTPGFAPSADVETLLQLPDSGQINSIAWKCVGAKSMENGDVDESSRKD